LSKKRRKRNFATVKQVRSLMSVSQVLPADETEWSPEHWLVAACSMLDTIVARINPHGGIFSSATFQTTS